ncbi:flagellar hook capping protein [Sulfurimonas sp. SAG-AH-194-L11]|nr:FlgD immunoglobulin-like domain containing protein [Sulfurimonas sp. SAG-AH-194-L11]MDF1876292.1 flagellar hook capping protein [Sulfurimonas sp. SAG-AH-194-L11]
MSITATTSTSDALATVTNVADGNPNGILGKDDFLKLLLVQLQYQDPTAPTDSETILNQTSQLAALESTQNTTNALEKLSASLASSQQFSTIAAIGKTADLGSDSIAYTEGSSSTFEVYFPNSVEQGIVNITNEEGSIVGTLDLGTNPAGVYQFTWDGLDAAGNAAASGIYSVNASYTDQDGNAQQTRLGAYPIESMRFENGETLVKVGSSYVPLENIVEIY